MFMKQVRSIFEPGNFRWMFADLCIVAIMFALPEEHVIKMVLQWAESTSSARAAILTSSRVNPEPCVDIFSDFDIELYVEDLAPFRLNDDWLESFGTVLVRCPWKPGSFEDGWLTRMAVFKEGFRIDFQITDRALAPQNYVDGFRVLLDKDGLTASLEVPTFEGYLIRQPTEEEYGKFVNEFWWDVIYVAKSLARDELFYAKSMFDVSIRFDYFQKLIEWNICIEHGWQTQPNKSGRFFKKYVSAELWAKIEKTFAGADIEENWVAFFNSLDLFRELAKKTGDYFNYPYPETLDLEVCHYLSQIREVKYPG
jgi:aminoglycoside 6-adenylyltransferase